MNSHTDNGRGGTGERRVYLIDRFRVSFHQRTAWKCACGEFLRSGACRHTREAAGMRDAQALIRQRLLVGGSGLKRYKRRVS